MTGARAPGGSPGLKGRRVIWLSGLAIVGFVTLFAYALTQLLHIHRVLSTDQGENMLWAVTQAEREARRLDAALLAIDSTPEPEATISLHLDLLHSRMALLQGTPQYAYFVEQRSADTLDATLALLEALTDRLDQTLPGTLAAALPLREWLEPLIQTLGQLANQTMLNDREQRTSQREQQGRTVLMILLAVAGLLVAGTLLAWQLLASVQAARRASLALLGHQAELEAKVIERTAALHSALETERHAKEIYRSFITTVSHQFRTPLSLIDMVAQRLMRRAETFPPEEVVAKASRIRSAGRRLNQLVASVTHAARLDNGEVQPARRRHDFNLIVRAACDYQGELTPGREIRLSLAEHTLDCDCDAALIEQIVLNLLANAVKYAPDTSPIEVRTWREGALAGCSVRDHGIGIPEAEQQHIFTRFFRASNAAAIVGSGLGLNLSQTIARLHGGVITLAAAAPRGTCFTLTLPLEPAAVPATTPAAVATAVPTPAAPPLPL